ncbi:P450-derived glycosyltransferase activator [Streptomyces sp. NPDC049555]|uniref:cytochrome P450 family protein n=1 Tax=Streptomyces sp. NPDC049555 TaxID=3154930 RepID=UPI00343818F8
MPTTTTTAAQAAPAPAAADVTDSVLGRHLLTVRGFHFVFGALGDPYARRLSSEPEAPGAPLHEQGPLLRSSLGAWVTGDADTAAALLSDARLGVRHPGSAGEQSHVHDNVWETWRTCHATPLPEDPFALPAAGHARLAGLVRPVLGPVSCPAWTVDAERAVHRVLDGLGPASAASGSFDLVADVVRPAVTGSLAAVLGLPGPVRQELDGLLAHAGRALDATLCPQRLPDTRAMNAALARVRHLLDGVLAAGPSADATGALLAVAGDDEQARAALPGACTLLTVAAGELAAVTVTNALLALLDHPDQWALLRADPERAPDAVEETLRWAPPVRMHSLITQEPLTVAGQDLPADHHVVVVVDAAHRDPRLHEDPERFDITRPRRSGFRLLPTAGAGYDEVVAPLVRLQSAVVLRAVADRLPRLRLAGEVLRRARSPITRAPLSVPCTGDRA